MEDESTEDRQVLRVLYVGGREDQAAAVSQLLSAATMQRFSVFHTARLGDGIDRPDGKELDLVLIDVGSSPDSARAEIAAACELVPALPIVALGAADDEVLSLSVLQAGARAFLFNESLTTTRVVTTLVAAIENQRTIGKLKAAQERERHLITHDHLTSLANRVLFNDALFKAVAAARSNGEKVAVLVMDLDHFGDINETLGHAVGDGLLRSVAEHLSGSLHKGDVAARLSGDEFALLLTGLADEFDAARVAGEILSQMCKPIPLRNRSIIATGSIGIAAYPRDATEPEHLIQRAHSAMDYAKRRGGNRYEFYTTDMNASAVKRATLEDRLRTALRDGGMVLHYQPQFDLRRERLVGAEALVRWQHPDFGLLGPETFLPMAEESGLIVPLGRQVLNSACQQNAEWHAMGHEGFRVSVNVSPMQFRERDFIDMVREALDSTGLRPECLEIEITESSLVRDAEGTVNALHALKELGVHLAIDDFGTGYSALSYLKHLPIDVLKIDQSFIRSLATDPADATIVQTVINMAKGLNLTTVAEGVETNEQLLLLGSYGCNRMQGFFFGKPVPADEFARLIANPTFRWSEDGTGA